MKHKLQSRALTVLLSVMLIIGLMPTTVFAAGTATVQINGQILQDGVSVQCGEGTAVLDKTKGTLTLDNATINQDGNVPALRVDNGDLKVILIDENTITSTTQRPFYNVNVDLTIQGTAEDSLTIKTDSDGLQADNSNLTIDGCKIDITSTKFGGMMCWGGTLTIQNGADITIDSFENALMGDCGLSITDSTVNATARSNYQDWSTTAISSNGNISITDSTVNATANGDAANAIYGGGTISINNSEVEATTTVQNNLYPALCAGGNIAIINHSTATVKSAGTIGIWSSGGEVVIQDSIAHVTAHDEWDAIRGSNGGVTISGSWVETFGSMVSQLFTHSDSAIFLNNEGEADGSLILPGDVTVSKDMMLSVPEDSSVTAPDGVTFTNHGSIEVLGSIVKEDGGTIVCDSHSGGTATCIEKAKCSICGKEYGDLGSHVMKKTEAKKATCTEDGNTEYYTCEICGKIFSDKNGLVEIQLSDTVIKAKGHSYENGKCTLCGAAEGSAQTGDDSSIIFWAMLAGIAALGTAGTALYRKRREIK